MLQKFTTCKAGKEVRVLFVFTEITFGWITSLPPDTQAPTNSGPLRLLQNGVTCMPSGGFEAYKTKVDPQQNIMFGFLFAAQEKHAPGCRFIPTFSETLRHRWYLPLDLNIGFHHQGLAALIFRAKSTTLWTYNKQFPLIT